jgi:hypothetical protein
MNGDSLCTNGGEGESVGVFVPECLFISISSEESADPSFEKLHGR